MALIRTSALISDITGRIGGTTFQQTQGGLTMRTQRTQKNSNTTRQQFQKTGIATILTAWINLTQAQREQWNQYAIYRSIRQKKNANKSISGQQIFIRENSLRYAYKDTSAIFANPIHSTPLFASAPSPIQITSVDENVGSLLIQHDLSVVAASQSVLLWMSAPIRESQQSRYTKRNLIKFTTIDLTTQDITNAYLSVYSVLPVVGQFVSAEIGLYDDTVKTYTRSTPVLMEVV